VAVARELHDHYFREAKREGYVSRAAYKLIEIDARKKLLRPGDWVLDCGAAPGSWLQVAAQRVGSRGVVVGVDPQPVAPQVASEHPSVRCALGDFRELPTDLLLELASGPEGASRRRFDVILSDMAPNTTGERSIDHHQSVRLCHAVLDRGADLLEPGGRLAMKVLEGEAYPDLLARTRRLFTSVKGFKPKASRHDSTEMYVIAQGYRGPDAGEQQPRDATQEQPPRRPSTGWGHPEPERH
jgi:23S rRNA (uridine2552-2'-O)-methyltransferase